MEKATLDVKSQIKNAENCRKEGNLSLAASIYQNLIKQQPDSAFLYNKLGQVKAQAQEWQEAIANYQTALKLGLSSPFWCYKNLGDALREAKQFEEAITSYQQAIKLNPNQPDVHDSLGQVQSLKGNYSSAIVSYRKAIDCGMVNSFWTYKNLEDALKAEKPSLESQNLASSKPSSTSETATTSQPTDNSESAKTTAAQPEVLAAPETVIFSELGDGEFIQWAFTNILGRKAGDSEIALFVKHFQNNTLNRSTALENILKSQEFSQKSSVPKETATPAAVSLFADKSDREYMEYLYMTLLKRPIDEKALEAYSRILKNGTTRTAIIESILKSDEFVATNSESILKDYSDYEFLHLIWEIILGQLCNVNAERQHLKLFDAGLSRKDLVIGLLKSEQFKSRVSNFGLSGEKPVAQIDTAAENKAWILGTDQFVSQEQWNQKLLQVLLKRTTQTDDLAIESPLKLSLINPLVQEFTTKKQYPLVSIITSLYKGGAYIEHFMANITSQTIFADCELIIIDANSPENESEVITAYQQRYNNIKYIRTEEVIGIYDAWNIGVENAAGEFCTNANLDDLRSQDSLEKQAQALLKHCDFDLVYQDVYYTFTPNLPFDVIAECNIKSNLPMATRANMLQFNSPHNAPMWRRNLHDKIGLFNTKYKSAGDYEMWLRAMMHGSRFLKIEEPSVAYYHNPEGLSTKSETRGVNEAIDIQRIYIKLFGNNFFSMTKRDFIDFCHKTFGEVDANLVSQMAKEWKDKESFLYQYFMTRAELNVAWDKKKYISFT